VRFVVMKWVTSSSFERSGPVVQVSLDAGAGLRE